MLDADPLAVITGGLDHKPELPILLDTARGGGGAGGGAACCGAGSGPRAGGAAARPLLARDFAPSRTRSPTLAERGFVLRSGADRRLGRLALRVRVLLARPRAREVAQAAAPSGRRDPRGLEDHALERGGGDDLRPVPPPASSARRLLVVDLGPHEVEDPLREEAGEDAEDDARTACRVSFMARPTRTRSRSAGEAVNTGSRSTRRYTLHGRGTEADELLRRALIDADGVGRRRRCASRGLPLCEALTVVFHGRRDLGTIQTYVAARRPRRRHRGRRRRAAARPVRPRPRRRGGPRRGRAALRRAGAAMRDALVAADTVLDVWREPLEELAERGRSTSTGGSRSTCGSRRPGSCRPRSSRRDARARRRRRSAAPRTLAEGRPPMGIACAQQDVARVYPLPTTPSAASRTSSSRGRPRAADGRAARPPGGVGQALPRALRRRVRRDRLTWRRRRAAAAPS